ncbi:MAG: dihydrofolate reductase [Thermoanaerobaculia bacterium]
MKVSLIAAMASNRTIGVDNRLPWRLPKDLKRFKDLTMGHALVMGRKTYDSVGHPLPGRTTIVITRQPDWRRKGVLVAHTLEDALALAEGDEVFVAGGEEVFRHALDRADRIYLTRIEKEFPGDTIFPEFEGPAWRLAEREEHGGEVPFAFELWERQR